MRVLTEIDWASDTIDLRDVAEVKEFVADVVGSYLTCRWCQEDINDADNRGLFTHKADGSRDCDPDLVEDPREDGQPRHAMSTGDRPDDEFDQLATITGLEKELQTDVWIYGHNQPVMVADHYKDEYAEEDAKSLHEIPDWLENYIDWKSWAEDFYNSEWNEIEIDDMGNHRTFYVRAYCAY